MKKYCKLCRYPIIEVRIETPRAITDFQKTFEIVERCSNERCDSNDMTLVCPPSPF